MVQVHYICAGGSRDAWFSVNGGPAKKFALPPTGKASDVGSHFPFLDLPCTTEMG